MNMIFSRDVGTNSFWDYIDQLSRQLETDSNKNTYPPYNIIRKSEDSAIIEFALAGIRKENLSVTMVPQPQKFSMLEIESKNINDDGEVNYERRGIAQRSFKTRIPLSEGWTVERADLENGMLTIELYHVIPDEQKPVPIEIQSHPQLT